jgi:hypothetical protein
MCQHTENLAEVITTYFPVDGPHSDETLSHAAAAIAELVRYLNHATLNPNSPALEWAATTYRVLSGLNAATSSLDQLTRQLDAALRAQQANSSLYDDRRDRPASATATEVRAALMSARVALGTAAEHLQIAANAASHLGND